MYYYQVYPVSTNYKDSRPLTYESVRTLDFGELVLIELKKQQSLGIVSRETKKPGFPTKPAQPLTNKYVINKEVVDFASWISDYYATPISPTLTAFVPQDLKKTSRKDEKLPSSKNIQSVTLPKLTSSQSNAMKAFSSSQLLMLHGDTGSGKTRVYIEMAHRVIKSGKNIVILTPEISLVPQLFSRFYEQFGHRVLSLHSNLTPSQKKKIWIHILEAKEPYVLIGPRSALLAPHKNLGLIVVDEAHESAYKQDQAPRYHAVRAALKLRQIHQCQLVLGSATPNIEDLYLFETKKLPIITLESVARRPSNNCIIVNTREREEFTIDHLLSTKLIGAIKEALQQKKQVLLLLNRRGSARIVMCASCSWEMACPHCDTNLIYHNDNFSVRCHICGYKEKPPTSCPVCKHSEILYKGVGTKALVTAVSDLFPEAKMMRFDTDNLSHERFEEHYESVLKGRIDIIVGTQIIAKGLDLPNLSVVGVIGAEAGLAFPDFTSEERTFQLVYQVMGRVNRGHGDGIVIIQTLQPDSPIIKQIVARDWQGFYKSQLTHRQTYRFPPFSYLLKIVASRKNQKNAEASLSRLRKKLVSQNYPAIIDMPAPCFIEKVRGQYRWQIIIRSKKRSVLQKIALETPPDFTVDLDPNSAI